MRIMTVNVRYEGGDEGEHAWSNRRETLLALVAGLAPDCFGLQEAMTGQVEAFAEAFPDHAAFGLFDEPLGAARNTIFAHRRYRPVDQGGYWLSESPHVPASKSWDAALVRIANWVVLEDPTTGRRFRLVNTHFDHKGERARAEQARLLGEDAGGWPVDLPQLLTGDLNCPSGSLPIERLKSAGWHDTWAASHGGDEEPGATFHGFAGPAGELPRRIDWIFRRGPVRAVASEVVRDRPGGVWPSDHYFLWADVELTAQ